MSTSNAGNVIYNKLVNTVGVTNLVSTRIRPSRAAQSDVYPYIVYEKISEPSLQTKDGNSGWYKARYQLSMLATSLASVQTIADAVRTTLDGVGGTIAGFTVQRITFEDERDIFNDNSAIDGVYMLQQDYFLTFQD
jgi:hypothetical protein